MSIIQIEDIAHVRFAARNCSPSAFVRQIEVIG